MIPGRWLGTNPRSAGPPAAVFAPCAYDAQSPAGGRGSLPNDSDPSFTQRSRIEARSN